METAEGFPNYVVKTEQSGAGLYVFVLAFTAVSFLSVAPLVVWGRRQEKKRTAQLQQEEEDGDTYRDSGDNTRDGLGEEVTITQARRRGEDPNGEEANRAQNIPQNPPSATFDDAAHGGSDRRRKSRKSSFGSIIRELDRFATTRYPDNDPDFMSRVSGRSRQGVPVTPPASTNPSNVPSAATTSRLHVRAASNQPRTRVWDVGGRKWKRRRPIGRPDVIHQAFYVETQTMGTTLQPPPADGQGSSANVIIAPPSPRRNFVNVRASNSRGMSDVAGSVLSADLIDDEAEIQELRATFTRQRSASNASDISFLRGPFIDDISPNDAADADDPGRQNSFEEVDSTEITCCCGPGAVWKPRTLLLGMDGLLGIAEPDEELRRIMILGVPRTLGAVSESLFRFVLVCFISHCVGTNALIAYLLVTRLIGFTDELMGAVTDAEGELCSHALSVGNFFAAGQFVQIALVVHLCLNAGVLAFWALFMDRVVEWFVASPEIAELALSYAQVIVFYHLIQSVSRNITILFHMTGNENFESRFAMIESFASLVVMACVVAVDTDATLETIGWIQLMIGIAALVLKVAYAILRGWLQPFLHGLLFSFALRNTVAVKALLVTSMPLFIGTFLEYGEWTLLMVFVQHLGPAEVATWCLLGLVWDILEASTEGVGEAAAVRVAYHLGNGNPDMAKKASYKAMLLSAIRSFIITSFLFMFGKSIALWLTTDPTLQHLFNDTLTLLGIGNIALSYAMMCWGLIGAQGRYRVATLVILVARWLFTTPVALICVYALFLDLDGVMASVIVGYATASTLLAYVLLRSDWNRLSRIVMEMNANDDETLLEDDLVPNEEGSPDEEAGNTHDESETNVREEKVSRRPRSS